MAEPNHFLRGLKQPLIFKQSIQLALEMRDFQNITLAKGRMGVEVI
jgi:hypothetical protein